MNMLKQIEQENIAQLHWPFFGCFMQQTPEAVLSLNRLLNFVNFDTIIELGTHDGGLSSLFALYCHGSNNKAYASHEGEPSLYKNHTHHKSPKQFYTFDIFERDIPRLNMLRVLGAKAEKLDFLNNPEGIEYVRRLITEGGRVLLLCDGGDKRKEFELYAPALKRGDIIMGHDWAKDEASFAALKGRGIWSNWETKWEDDDTSTNFGLKKICHTNDIVQVLPEEFDNVAWFCGLKQ